jgi:hypothetical protein
MHRLTCLIAILSSVAFSTPAAAAVYRVGSGPGCTHASIQAAIGAAAASAASDEIRLSATLAYSQQALLVDGAQGALVLAGGYATCADDAPVAGARTLVDGDGNLPVLRINATRTVSLQSLDIGGGGTTGRGGGIYATGSGGAVLALSDTLVRGNQAYAGGGIAVLNSDAQADPETMQLLLFGNSAVSGNSAVAGGGVQCIGATVHLFDNAHVSLNTASDYGGGVYALDCRVEIGSRGIGGAVLWANSAGGDGGALYLYGSRSDADFYTIDAQVPARIVGNSASRGGAIAIAREARMRMFDARIESNTASAQAGAVFVSSETGASADTRFTMRGAPDGAVAAAVRCADPESCNRVDGNQALDGSVRRPGAAIVVAAGAGHSAHAMFHGTRFDGNIGESLTRHAGDHGQIAFNGALLVENDASGALLDAPGAANSLALVATTIARNAIGSGHGVIAGAGYCDPNDDVRGTYVHLGIVWQPGHVLIASPDAPQPFCFQHLLGNDFGDLPPTAERIVSDPLFRNAAVGDYRLSLGSIAIDFAPATAQTATRDGGPRVFDFVTMQDRFGAQDLGAYELAPDLIFADGFEPTGA